MDGPNVVSIHDLEQGKKDFLDLLDTYGHVFITGATGLYTVAHRVNTVHEIDHVAKLFHKLGLSPRPALSPLGHNSVDGFWVGVRNNILNLRTFAGGLVVLTESRKAVILMQNLVNNAESVYAALSEDQLRLIYPGGTPVQP